MKPIKKKKLSQPETKLILSIFLIVLSILILVGSCVFIVWTWVTYGNKPIDEVPFWAFFTMWGR